MMHKLINTHLLTHGLQKLYSYIHPIHVCIRCSLINHDYVTGQTRGDNALPARNMANTDGGSFFPQPQQSTAAASIANLGNRLESSLMERKFDNPIYGDGEADCGDHAAPLNRQSLTSQEFVGQKRIENPIYGEGESDYNYTIPSDYYLWNRDLANPIYGTDKSNS